VKWPLADVSGSRALGNWCARLESRSGGFCPDDNGPDTRYLSVVDNDAHYATTQHIADLAMDPVKYYDSDTKTYVAYENPFVVGLGSDGYSYEYTSGQYFMVPISLGLGVSAGRGQCPEQSGWPVRWHAAAAEKICDCRCIVLRLLRFGLSSSTTSF